jgi:biopolymer transport protein ExbD
MRRRRHSQSNNNEDSHGIDLAPMLDFVLNLLIFFIITAVFVKESGMVVNRPGGSTDQTTGGGSIPVLVLEDGGVVVDGRPVDLRAVQANINRLHAANPNKGVLVIADQDAQTGVVATVIDQVRLGGIYNITFSTSS